MELVFKPNVPSLINIPNKVLYKYEFVVLDDILNTGVYVYTPVGKFKGYTVPSINGITIGTALFSYSEII